MSSHMGRPKVKNPKITEVKARIDEETNNKILDYCKRNNINRAEFIRKGVLLVLKDEA